MYSLSVDYFSVYAQEPNGAQNVRRGWADGLPG